MVLRMVTIFIWDKARQEKQSQTRKEHESAQPNAVLQPHWPSPRTATSKLGILRRISTSSSNSVNAVVCSALKDLKNLTEIFTTENSASGWGGSPGREGQTATKTDTDQSCPLTSWDTERSWQLNFR